MVPTHPASSPAARTVPVQVLLATEHDVHRLQRELVRASLLHCPRAAAASERRSARAA